MIKSKLMVSTTLSIIIFTGCTNVSTSNQAKPTAQATSTNQASKSTQEASTGSKYDLAFNEIKDKRYEEADKLLEAEIKDVFFTKIDLLPVEKQDLVNLRYFVKVQKSIPNDLDNAVNYLNQLKPIKDLVSEKEIKDLLSKYQPEVDAKWSNKYTREQLLKDNKAPSKNPEDYNSKGEYVPKNGASKNPADYNAKGEYKPVESMTKEEKLKELEEMLNRATR
ncbi:hypothetical protein HQN90_11130 [Paenibacillus alba]|uniref:hypothetical protein n=1 Tax=Paenibacillus alba TaxID=1197127 RepID=UPI0015659FAA|nr:hypothetical protein [Paenibacillus alba]NQX66680.1 hypothetical protein [Paenibacillus alba]